MDEQPFQEDATNASSVSEGLEATCWGCGLRLILSDYAAVFKCGWCGAVTRQDAARKLDSVCFSYWRRFRDKFFVAVLLIFITFVISAGVWAVYPIVFSTGYLFGIFSCTIAAILSVVVLSTFCLASFRSAGAPANVVWGSYPAVGKNHLDNYTFCTYCSKPKPPRAHHCRSCKMCVMDMDHHCPFIGNCVGAENHRAFVFFLISVVISCTYVAVMAIFSLYRIWPTLGLHFFLDKSKPMRLAMIKDFFLAIASSSLFLSPRALILIYLTFASLSVEIGITVLLWQQLTYIYEGNTYLNRLSSTSAASGEGGWQNVLRFFGCPFSISRFVLSITNSGKLHNDSNTKLL